MGTASSAGHAAQTGPDRMVTFDDPTEHARYLVVEATAQRWAGVGITLLRKEKFSVRLGM